MTARRWYRSMTLAMVAGAALLLVAAPAAAGITGPCTAELNGQDVNTIDTPGTALEVDVEDTITATGTDNAGTTAAQVGVKLAGFSAYIVDAEVDESTWTGTVEVSDYAFWGVGIYEVLGKSDNCEGFAFVKVTGRSPFTTIIGGTATVLTLGGLAMALASWIPAFSSGGGGFGLGIGGGLLGGLGLVLLLQQLGVMPLSGPVAIAGLVGGPVVGGGLTWLGKLLAARGATPV
jgi:hypothetical protein